MPRTNVHDWYVEVEHPDGNVLEPTIVGSPTRLPKVNALSEIRIPVRRENRWSRNAFEDQRMNVWYKGEQLPIETLKDVQQQEGQTVLVARGGIELENRVTKEYTSKPIHEAATDIIQTATPYTANVDAPPSDTLTNETVQTASTQSDFEDLLPVKDTDPIEITTSDEVVQHQTAFVSEAEHPDRDSAGNYALQYYDNGDLSGGEGQGIFDYYSYVEYDFTPQYRIPADRVGVAARTPSLSNAKECQILLIVNGTEYILDELSGGEGTTLDWAKWGQDLYEYNGPGYQGPDIPAGSTVTVRLFADGNNGSDYGWDVVALYDRKFSYTWDNVNDGSDGYLHGPELYPATYDLDFEDHPAIYVVTGGRAEVTMNDTSNDQELALTNDGGNNYPITASNTTTVEGDFADGGASLGLRVTLSRWGSRTTATPQTGFNSQSISEYTLYADLDRAPTLLINETFDAQALNILSEIAERGDYIFEYQDNIGTKSIEMAKFGSRAEGTDQTLSGYSTTKSTQNVVQKATIKGGSEQIEDEEFTSSVGSFVSLPESFIVPSSEIVVDPSNGNEFDRGYDYEMGYINGEIKVLSGGDMTDSTTYEITYKRKFQNTVTADGYSDPREVVQELPVLVSDRACGQAANRVVQKLKNPIETATLTFPSDELNYSLINQLYVPGVPTDQQRFQVRGIEAGGGTTTVELGRQETLQTVLSSISSRVRAAASQI
jgi:hypothetical protein